MRGPAEDAVSWAESAAGQAVVDSRGLREGGAPWLLTFDGGMAAVLRSCGDTELAALRLAARHGIPAPRVLAVGDGMTLLSVVTGSSRIPVTSTDERLAALGAAAALIHALELAPSKDLPLRHRPIELVDFDRWRARDGAATVWRSARDAVTRPPEPSTGPVFVHGDLWQGNTMWSDGELAAIVDWDNAGTGHPGVDLGSLRCDAAILYGGDAPEILLAGWQERAERPAEHVAYWDVVAALSTPPDLTDWESTIQDQGRTDLDGATLTARRDTFLHAALDLLR
ncbi:MAG TPA: aminoglycoside phosphotransferase family protein [Pseudonocardiaceae bacterium]